jgi:hypothetical protein
MRSGAHPCPSSLTVRIDGPADQNDAVGPIGKREFPAKISWQRLKRRKRLVRLVQLNRRDER